MSWYRWTDEGSVVPEIYGTGSLGSEYATPIELGAQHWYHFDEGEADTVYDQIGSDNITLYNSPSWLSNGGLSFNGTNQYGSNTLLTEFTGSISVVGVWEHEDTGSSINCSIWMKEHDIYPYQILSCDRRTGGNNYTFSHDSPNSSSILNGPKKMSFHAFTYNNSTQQLNYWNNKDHCVDNYNCTGWWTDSGRFSLWIARDPYSSPGYAKCTFHTLAIFHNKVLTTLEIYQLYNYFKDILFKESWPDRSVVLPEYLPRITKSGVTGWDSVTLQSGGASASATFSNDNHCINTSWSCDVYTDVAIGVRWTGTWSSLGLPSGRIVKRIRLTSFKSKYQEEQSIAVWRPWSQQTRVTTGTGTIIHSPDDICFQYNIAGESSDWEFVENASASWPTVAFSGNYGTLLNDTYGQGSQSIRFQLSLYGGSSGPPDPGSATMDIKAISLNLYLDDDTVLPVTFTF